jgi:hypothetical protein
MDLFKIVYPRLCVGPMPLTGGNSRHFQLPDVDGDKQEEFAVISRCSTWELLVVIQPGDGVKRGSRLLLSSDTPTNTRWLGGVITRFNTITADFHRVITKVSVRRWPDATGGTPTPASFSEKLVWEWQAERLELASVSFE